MLHMDERIRLIPVYGQHVLVDVVELRRITVDPVWAPLCARAAAGWHNRTELADAVADQVDAGRAGAFVDFLAERGFLTYRDRSADPLPTAGTAAPSPQGASERYWEPSPITVDDLPADRALRGVRALLIGGCVTQFAADALVRAGLRRGLAVTPVHEWPAVRGRMRDLVERHRPDLAVLQPTVQPLLTGLWDDAAFAGVAERRRRLAVLKRALTAAVTEFAAALGGCPGLVHNVAPPAVSPFGRYDFRHEANHREIVAELNRHVDEQVRQHPGLFVVDEERITARYGAARLFDDLLFPFGHHGGRPDPAVDAPNQLPALSNALAREYVAGYLAHQGLDRVKCVVTDLDHTLWPGIAADDGFGWVHADTTGRWIHLGLHQALKILRHRGVLLATCSKGTESATVAAWAQAPPGHLLAPDDFVLHRINWQPKSANIADICDRLGLAPSAVLFLDDNPVERAEVRRHLPGVRVPELPVHGFRELLLTEPGLESPAATDEARRRTETTRAMLRRAELVADPDGDFLRELAVTVVVWPATPDDLPRATELFNRTNQFTTTEWRTTETELGALLADGHELYLAAVTDRFADYGTVAACLIVDDVVRALAVSCRVIGLDVAPGFLATCLRQRPGDAPVSGRIVGTGRNHAAHDVFLRTGFHRTADDRYALTPGDMTDLADVPQQFTVRVEARR